MANLKSVAAKCEKHPRYKVPQRIYSIDKKATKKAAGSGKVSLRKSAEAFLRKIAKELGIKSDLSQLRFDKVKSSILGHHVLFQQYHDSKPISGAWIKVDIDKDLRVYNILNDLVPESFFKRAAKKAKKRQLSKNDAIGASSKGAGLEKEGRQSTALETEQVFYAGSDGPIPAWKVVIQATNPTEEWKVYVDADSGEVLEKQSLIRHATGTGLVFNPNPVVALNDTDLSDASSVPDDAYEEVTLEGLSTNGKLDGQHVSTRLTANRISRESRAFTAKRGQQGFNEVMIYYHIDRVQRYIQELGFDNVNNRQIEVNAAESPQDQSFYLPSTKTLHFGLGGVDDAEDADIILHEYGHSIQDDQVPGFGASSECRSMGEGFGDYLAGSFFADLKSDSLKPCVGSWDATSYSAEEPPCLRRLDSNKKYPKDMVREEHDDGEIWSACLWELRAGIGRRKADKLILAHHFLISRLAKFEDAANALLVADEQLNEGANATTIRDIFVRRGILKNSKRKGKRAGARGKPGQ